MEELHVTTVPQNTFKLEQWNSVIRKRINALDSYVLCLQFSYDNFCRTFDVCERGFFLDRFVNMNNSLALNIECAIIFFCDYLVLFNP